MKQSRNKKLPIVIVILSFPIISITFFLLLLLIGTYFFDINISLIIVMVLFFSVIVSGLFFLFLRRLSLKVNLYIFSFCAVFFFLVVLVSFYVYTNFKKFKQEEVVYETFSPMVEAIYKYQEDYGRSPSSLTDLIPKYINKIPSSDLIKTFVYMPMKNNKCWELKLYDKRHPRLIYMIRSDNEYSPSEQEHILKQFHSIWTLLEL